MCTIGVVFQDRFVHLFKQCDLTEQTQMNTPQYRSGGAGQYIAMTREGRPGLWAGFNQTGTGLVAADAYTVKDYPSGDWVNALFNAYENVAANCTSAEQAAESMKDFYLDYAACGYMGFPDPDICLVSDSMEAIFIEYSPDKALNNPNLRMLSVSEDYFPSTNHFRMLLGEVESSVRHSTYLRLDRAEAILFADPTFQGVVRTLRDQHYGQTQLSVCRVAQVPGEYYTQASVIFTTNGEQSCCNYLVNGNPRTENYTTICLPQGNDAPGLEPFKS